MLSQFNKLLVQGLATVGLVTAANASATSYPCNPVKLVSPYAPGGTTDILARMLAPSLQKSLGVTVIVENKAGASGNIGTEFVGRAKPDGCTVLLGNNTTVVINRNLYKLGLDPIKSLVPVVEVAAVPLVLYVNDATPAKTVDELVKEIRANPGKYSYASPGSGSPQHLAGELLKLQRNIDIAHIPYKGSGPALTDVIAGHVQVSFEAAPVIVPHLQSRKIRPLATTSVGKSVLLPDLPTMSSLGFTDFDITNWYGVFAPAGTPKELVQRINQGVREALAAPQIAAKLSEMGSAKVDGTPEAFSDYISKEIPRWESLVKKSNAKVD